MSSISSKCFLALLIVALLASFTGCTGAARSARGKAIVSIVLDRSGSMTVNGGAAALQSAGPTFVADFDNAIDEVAMISFSSNATVDVPINYNFKTPIDHAIATMRFMGGTFGTGAGTQPILSPTTGAPLSLAQLQNDSVVVQPKQKVVKVVVYFTDGLMNTIQDNFYCKGKDGSGLTLVNYGGYDFGISVGFFDPASATTLWGTGGMGGPNGFSPGPGVFPNGFAYDNAGEICRNAQGQPVTTFPSQQSGTQEKFTRANITAEAQYRAIVTANALRTEAPLPTYIYTIGLGSSVSPTTQALLAQLANDPNYPTYIPGQPAGQFFYIADCPSPSCTAELNTAFQAIASKVHLQSRRPKK